MKIQCGERGTVFNLEVNQRRKNTITGNVSTYEGKNQNNKAVYSSWQANFVGKAFEAAKELTNKDKIVILSANLTNSYSREKNRDYTTLTIFEFIKLEDKSDNEKIPIQNEQHEVETPPVYEEEYEQYEAENGGYVEV
ncbi:MAG: hypothetical protein SOR72_04430 [Hornefia sp.]|nr:hypothetical protein [Hornefia sp.]